MFKSIFSIFVVAVAMKTGLAQASEVCSTQSLRDAVAQGCAVLSSVPTQYRNTDIEAGRTLLCYTFQVAPSLTFKQFDQAVEIIITTGTEPAVKGLINAKNELLIQDLERLQFSDRVSKLMYLRTSMHVADLECALSTLK
jgi:hypothetical protein